MLSGLLNSFRDRISLGGQNGQGQDEGSDEDDNIQIPQMKTSMIGSSSKAEAPLINQNEANGGNLNEEVETYEGTGVVTVMDLDTQKGVINRQYQFDMEKFCTGWADFHRGARVEFRAERSRTCPQWIVTHMKLEETENEKTNKERRKFKTLSAKVKRIEEECILVDVGKENALKSPRIIRIPNNKEFKVDFQWMPGDWMKIQLMNDGIDENEEFDCEAPADSTRCKILSIAPVGRKTVVGRVTKRVNNFLIDDSIYFTQNLCNFQIHKDTFVKCTAISSEQYLSHDERLHWRAIEVEKSRFLIYNDSGVMDATENVCAEDKALMHVDDVGKLAIQEHELLMSDKFGLKVIPKNLYFPVQLVNTSAIKTLKIRNENDSQTQSFELKQICWNNDPTVCEFTAEQQARPTGDISPVLFPGEEIIFNITCCPKMIGRTSEMCVFHFEEFSIACTVSVIGQSDDGLFDKKSKDVRPKFKKQAGNKDLTRFADNHNRRRVRGSPLVRSPFFSSKRIPLFPVPKALYQILKDQNETELLSKYPKALSVLQFENYTEKFHVSLWFEEIENDLRRRQYDLHNVRLKKGHGDPVLFSFAAPGIQDYTPPVNLQDTVDVFDEDNRETAKFQGTIMKIVDNEVTCIFGDAFNNQYTGFSVTVQFNLGRTNYKRCHYAVETAYNFLGKDFLFPENNLSVKPARILVLEDEDDVNPEEIEITEQKFEAEQNLRVGSIFQRAKPVTTFTESQLPGSSNSDVLGRRVKSVRSRFVSDTASTPSCTSAKLIWFNKNLNNEQKNAVRRILRGQARPLPYIIYGPPGTGKTVTLIEAIMQVNKLDKNSRVLVCAPSNAAADVIAEYLANSNEYLPGDFYRLNGFLRSGQTMLETIAPFCTDGEDLANLAMHRLLISTCMTAGQFFSLDLSAGHFTHVFVDEAGYCTEPETMVPAVLLALSKGGQLILAGDPNQLGPVLMSDVSQNCGLNKSFLERLMTRQLYRRDAEQFPKEKHNPLVVTKLVNNYRAHKALLKLPSQLFYDDDLVAKASYEEAYDLCQHPDMQEIVKVEGVPMIFHGVQGHCSKEADSPSWCNKAEVIQVVQYVSMLIGKCGLKTEDIGIITPYRKQVEKIRMAMQMSFASDEIPKVASVEEFQGGERKVIIISTVRSVNQDRIKVTDEFYEKMTFLYQPKRFNVAITRAKALMIVIGNPHLLDKNRYWSKLLQYALSLSAYKGCNLPIHLDGFLRSNVVDKNIDNANPRKTKEEESETSTSEDDET